MKQWLKEIFRSVLREEMQNCPLIIAARALCEDDVYQKGTTWLHGNERYIIKRVKVDWEKA